MFRLIDVSGDGTISLPEFLKFVRQNTSKEECVAIFSGALLWMTGWMSVELLAGACRLARRWHSSARLMMTAPARYIDSRAFEPFLSVPSLT